MAADFLAALVDWWSSNGALSAAGLPIIHFNVAPGAVYPYATLHLSGSNVSKRNFVKSYIDVDKWTFTIISADEDQVASLGLIATAALDTLSTSPLTFDDGQQVTFWRSGSHLAKLRQQGTEGIPFVWAQNLFYTGRVVRTFV